MKSAPSSRAAQASSDWTAIPSGEARWMGPAPPGPIASAEGFGEVRPRGATHIPRPTDRKRSADRYAEHLESERPSRGRELHVVCGQGEVGHRTVNAQSTCKVDRVERSETCRKSVARTSKNVFVDRDDLESGQNLQHGGATGGDLGVRDRPSKSSAIDGPEALETNELARVRPPNLAPLCEGTILSEHDSQDDG